MQIPSQMYQSLISVIVSLPIRRDPGAFMNVLVREHRALNN